MRIRRARPGESPSLSGLALLAKSHWGYPASALAAWADQLAITPESLEAHPTFVCEGQGKPVGVCQLSVTGNAATLEHLWVHPDFKGQGAGRMLLDAAFRHAVAAGATAMLVDADPHAEGFYLAQGAVRTGEIAAPIEGQPDRVRPQLRIELGAT